MCCIRHHRTILKSLFFLIKYFINFIGRDKKMLLNMLLFIFSKMAFRGRQIQVFRLEVALHLNDVKIVTPTGGTDRWYIIKFNSSLLFFFLLKRSLPWIKGSKDYPLLHLYVHMAAGESVNLCLRFKWFVYECVFILANVIPHLPYGSERPCIQVPLVSCHTLN